MQVGQESVHIYMCVCVHVCIISLCVHAGPERVQALNYRFERRKKAAANYEDIFDGFQYQRLLKNDGPLSRPGSISFTVNTDGVGPLFQSTAYEIWPVLLMINEFPYYMRYSISFIAQY